MNSKDRRLIFGIIVFIEIIIFLATAFVIGKITLQIIFGIFSVLWLIGILISFIYLRRASILLKKNKNPIKAIGLEKINFYYKNATEVNINDLIIIKKAEIFKTLFYIFIGLLISIALTLIAFYV